MIVGVPVSVLRSSRYTVFIFIVTVDLKTAVLRVLSAVLQF